MQSNRIAFAIACSVLLLCVSNRGLPLLGAQPQLTYSSVFQTTVAGQEPRLAIRTWIREILMQTSCGPVPVNKYYKMAGLKMPETYPVDTHCTGLGALEVELFVACGPEAIPELLPYSRSSLKTGYVYKHPALSSINLDEVLTVGEISCFLIEAIIREDSCFSWSGRLDCSEQRAATLEELKGHPSRCSFLSPKEQKFCECLCDASSKYEDWYQSWVQMPTSARDSLPGSGVAWKGIKTQNKEIPHKPK